MSLEQMETLGEIIHPAEPLLVLCLPAQQPSRPETELYVPPSLWKSGGRTCDCVTAARNESEESSRLAENLNREIRTLRCRARDAAAQAVRPVL